MKTTPLVASVAGVFGAGLALVGAIAWAQEGAAAPEPKYSIEEVMEQAHKEGLLNKVAGGEASDEEKAQLLDLYISLTESDPPKGDPAAYHKLAADAVVAAARVVVGREGAEGQLKRAVNCAACHKEHRPPSE